MAAADSRARCPTCQSPSACGWEPNRQLAKPPPIRGENPRGRKRAARIRRQNGGGK